MDNTETPRTQSSQSRYETTIIDVASRIFSAYVIAGSVNYPNEEAMMDRAIDYSIGIIKKVKARLGNE